MKHVLILFSMSFEPYQGRYSRAYNEAKGLVNNGYQVTVLAWDRSGESTPLETRDGIRIKRIHTAASDTTSIKTLPMFMQFAAKVMWWQRNQRFDVVHCHNLQLLPLGIFLQKTKQVPLVFDSCEPDYFALYPSVLHGVVCLFEKIMVRMADAVLVHNDYQIGKYSRMGHPGVFLIGSYPALDMIRRRSTQDTPAGKKIVFGRIGSIYRDNGIEEMLAAFRLLLKRREDVHLFFAGRIFDAYQETFNSLIRGMEDHVTVVGAFDSGDMPDLYRKIDISIMIYKRSLWFQNITPTKFFDSLAFGVPVIVSDMGGLKEMVEKYRCGMVVDEEDPRAVADAMEAMIENPEQLAQMKKNGVQAFRERFNWDLMLEKFIDIYAGVTDRKKSAL
jgi:glycosyltransferase involved in cell wall biosynthesis